nr:hypothetical protein [Tanacetum cinerariifolium]
GLEYGRYGVSKVLDTVYQGYLRAQLRCIFLDGYGVLDVKTCNTIGEDYLILFYSLFELRSEQSRVTIMDLGVHLWSCRLFWNIVKNLYADFLHADCVNDYFDPLDYWKYEDVYSGGCFYVGGSFKGFDWIDEHVGFDDRSLLGKSKNEFSNEVILDDVVSSPATTLSLLLKRKGKSRVKFTRMRSIIKRLKMLSLRKSVRSNYGRFITVIGLNEDVGVFGHFIPYFKG